MALKIFSRDDGFYSLFELAANTSNQCARQLVGILRSVPPTESEIQLIMQREREADEIVREVNRRLERSPRPPFDRQDVQTLATYLDDITDEIFAAADLVLLHRVTSDLPGIFELVDILEQATGANCELVSKLRVMRGIRDGVDAIDRLESSADRVFRRITSELFSGRHDALDILRWKAIVEAIERAINAVERASDHIQSIAIKHG